MKGDGSGFNLDRDAAWTRTNSKGRSKVRSVTGGVSQKNASNGDSLINPVKYSLNLALVRHKPMVSRNDNAPELLLSAVLEVWGLILWE